MTKHFSEEEEAESIGGFKNGESISTLAQKVRCSYSTIRRFLNSNVEKYKKIAKEHRSSSCRKMGQLPNTEKQKEAARKIWQLPKTEKQIEASRKNGQNYIGKKNPNWKGGISVIPFEKKYGMSPEEWKILAQDVRKRNKFICQYCGKKNSTSVHHIFPRRVKIDNHPDNLITLCRSCHIKVEHLTNKYLKKNRDPIEIFYEKWNGK